MQQDIQQIVDFDSAILAHAEWKLRLTQYICGEGKLNPASICQDNQCLLGKWIYGAGQKFKGNLLFEPLRLAHQRFHRTAAKVVETVDAGQVAEARAMIADNAEYGLISKEVIGYLFTLKEDLTNITAKLIENVEVGFFLIGSDMRIRPSYSKACLGLFQLESIDNLRVAEAFGLTGEAAEDFEAQVGQIFDDFLPESILLDQLPRRLATPGGQVGIHARVLRDRAGLVSEILFTVHDITALVQTERENQENRTLLDLAMQRESFRNFLVDTEECTRAAIEAIEAQREELARRSLHTIKGNSGFYGLDSLVSTIHEVESKPGIDLSDVSHIENQLRSFVHRIERITGPLQSESADAPIARPVLERLEAAVAAGEPGEIAAAAAALLAESDMRGGGELLGPFQRATEVLAARLDKKAKLEIVNPSVRFSKKRWAPVFRNLVHLLRNALDHGVEPLDMRGDKPEVATIRVEFIPEGILFSDDGAGINPERLLRRAIEKGMVSAEEAANMSQEEVFGLIFRDSFSTAEAVSETSGRGVGMSAVKQAIEEIGGQIRIDSHIGRGTTFHLLAPPMDSQCAAAA